MSVAATPSRYGRQPVGLVITEAQKQALADNLQLEITERARKMRQNYALMSENLRYRLEMRVNRIPSALRKVNLQELIDRAAMSSVPARVQEPTSLKRSSEVMTDKENSEPSTLANPKKRQKQTPTEPSHSPIRKAVPVTVLSPKSLNSRIIPPTHTTLKPSPSKMNLPRPISPVKTTSTATKGYKAVSKTARPNGTNAVESANGDVYTIQIDEPVPTAKAKAAKPTAKAKAVAKTTTTASAAKKGGLKGAFASLTSGKRAAARTDEPSDTASEKSVPTSSRGRVLRNRIAG